ncbi:signal peptidase I [Catenulispora sp. GP43]|uniref:S26 family signal peptidase n=1 Tax=Catenulispora sp. GP43 TaxID=3156263 RepID=UPI0035134A25
MKLDGRTVIGGRAVFAAGVAVGALGVLAARRALVLITVSGGSMSPTYTDGEKLVVRRGRLRTPRVGDVIVFRHPQLARTAATATQTPAPAPAPAPARPDVDWMVKRVVAIEGDRVPEEIRHAVGATDAGSVVPPGFLLVRGDDPVSLDSRHFGYLPTTEVLGVSVRRRPRASALR